MIYKKVLSILRASYIIFYNIKLFLNISYQTVNSFYLSLLSINYIILIMNW